MTLSIIVITFVNTAFIAIFIIFIGGEERMIEESRLNKKRVDYINTYGINSFEKLTEAEKEKLF
jgi:hypothetical protein